MPNDEIADQIIADLEKMNRHPLTPSASSWIRCDIVVVEEMEARPWGHVAYFLVPPRVGEHVGEFGTVVSITHGPMLPEGSSLPYLSNGVED